MRWTRWKRMLSCSSAPPRSPRAIGMSWRRSEHMIGPVTRRRFLRTCSAAAALASTSAAQQRKTKSLILVTADGLRWQDLFTGIDPLLMNQKDAGMTETGAPGLRDRLWKPQPEERRMALLPYFWGTLAPSGIVLGNLTKGSSVQVTNRYRVSYPGYSEILTGRAQDDVIRGNDPVQNPTPSFLQLVKDRSEERRVGKEGRFRGAPCDQKK